MRSAPLNYLITIALGCLLWAVTGVLFGATLGDRVTLQVLTTTAFLATYRVAIGVVTAIAIASCLYWFFAGSKDTVSGTLADAKKTWTSLFITQLVVAAVDLAVLAFLLRAEDIAGSNYLLISLLLVLQAPAFFWLCTFLMSPRAVQFIPWGKRLLRRS